MHLPGVVVVGLDAVDRGVAQELMDRGRMPHLARLVDGGLVADLENPVGLTSSSVWPTIVTGVGPDRHQAWSWRQLRPGTYRMRSGLRRPLQAPTFWERLARQGVRSLVVDVPVLEISPGFGGTQIVGWSDHDRTDDLESTPPEVADELRSRVDHQPRDPCEAMTVDLPALRRLLVGSVAQKVDLVEYLLERDPHDLAVIVWGEGHCAGHHFWHLHQPSGPPGTDAGLGDVVAEVYEAIDVELGRLLDLVGAEAVVMVVLSHGIGNELTPVHLIEPVLKAIDARLGPPPRVARVREFLRRAPNRAARVGLRLVRRDFEHLDHVADGSRRFFSVPIVPPHSAIRLNLAGREPRGLVAPEEADELCDRLEAELAALVDVESGVRLMKRFWRTERLWPGGTDIGLPDVLVEWDSPSPVTAVASPTLGEFTGAYRGHRTGGHRRDGRVVISGPGVDAGTRPAIPSVDIAPTIASLCGASLDNVDGEPVIGAARV